MRKKVRKIILSVFALTLTATQAFGADIYDIKYDLEKSVVTVSGKAGKSQDVTLEVLKPDVKTENLSSIDISKVNEYIYRVDETKTDENGNFEFSFGMKTGTGNYITRIYTGDYEEDLLLYVNYTEFKSAFDELNNETDADKVVTLIETKGNLLGMTNKYYNDLTSEEKLNVANRILSDRNANENSLFSDVNEILKSYNTATVLEKAGSGAGGELIEEYKDVLGIDKTAAYKTYAGFNDSEKKELSEMLSGADYTDTENFAKEFSVKTVLLEVKNAENYKDLYTIFSENNDVLNLDMNRFNSLSEYDKATALQKITGRQFASAEELRTAFSQAMVVSVVVPSGGGYGGGGNSSGSGKSAVSIITPAVTNTNNAEEKPFSDLESVGWAEDSITSLYEKGIVSGKEQGRFYPLDLVKREEFVKMLIAGMGENAENGGNPFADVADSAWYAPYVIKANNLGLVMGVDEGRFGAGMNITREDLVTILYRASLKLGMELPKQSASVFADKDLISGYAKEAVNALSGAGIISGNENGEFMPAKNATRAETAKILDGFLMFLN